VSASKRHRRGVFFTNPNQFGGLAIGIGLSVACGLIGRGREDILRMFDRDPKFAAAFQEAILQSWLSDAMSETSDAEIARSFTALIDGAIAKADAATKGKAS
jgi:hypothetical protein